MSPARRLLASFSLLLALTACGDGKSTMLFHAGVGQRSSLNEIKTLFEERHPEIDVNFAYKGSGYFIADIARSKTGDLYMPGEEFYLLQAVERGYVADYDPQHDVAAYFITVLITPKGNPKNIRTLADCARPGVRIGLGNPRACAIGIWQEKTFKRAGVWDAVRENATLSAKCIPELGNAVQHKLVDATIVWATTAVLYLRDIEIVPLEPTYRGAVRLPVAVLAFSKFPKEARLLKDLILSERGKEVFRSHAYAVGEVPTDEAGFVADGGASTEPLMRWLQNAARAVKDDAFEGTPERVGPLRNEVQRQQKTIHAGT